MPFIYKITNPSGKVYIGSTDNLEKRWKHYKYLNCKNQPRIYNSLKKYGYINHLFEILEECEIDNILEREAYYGNIFNSLDQKVGLNCKLPKKGDIYQAVSNETKAKMIGNKNAVGKRSNDIKKKLSIAKSGKNNPQYGKHKTNEQKLHQSKKMKGYDFGEEFSKNLSERQSKITYQFTMDGILINSFKSAKEAYNITKIRNISGCCIGLRNHAGGFKWSYKDNIT